MKIWIVKRQKQILHFLLLICLIIIIVVLRKKLAKNCFQSSIDSKNPITYTEQYDISYFNYKKSLKIYSDYFILFSNPTIKSTINFMSNRESTQSNRFDEINHILFVNRAVLADPNILTLFVNDKYEEIKIKNIFEKQNINSHFLMSFLLDIKYLSNFFKVFDSKLLN